MWIVWGIGVVGTIRFLEIGATVGHVVDNIGLSSVELSG